MDRLLVENIYISFEMLGQNAKEVLEMRTHNCNG